uniref:Uncharacterized protein LOC110200181 n=1 Tax=Phascolarctos cinereus TaxID=38626 RepID=A0A6P5JCD0_PHACI|nr:uncharacterized protein LOC110200181 [Phascolarctos cinereus]
MPLAWRWTVPPPTVPPLPRLPMRPPQQGPQHAGHLPCFLPTSPVHPGCPPGTLPFLLRTGLSPLSGDAPGTPSALAPWAATSVPDWRHRPGLSLSSLHLFSSLFLPLLSSPFPLPISPLRLSGMSLFPVTPAMVLTAQDLRCELQKCPCGRGSQSPLPSKRPWIQEKRSAPVNEDGLLPEWDSLPLCREPKARFSFGVFQGKVILAVERGNRPETRRATSRQPGPQGEVEPSSSLLPSPKIQLNTQIQPFAQSCHFHLQSISHFSAGMEVRKTWIQIPLKTLVSCVTLAK